MESYTGVNLCPSNVYINQLCSNNPTRDLVITTTNVFLPFTPVFVYTCVPLVSVDIRFLFPNHV